MYMYIAFSVASFVPPSRAPLRRTIFLRGGPGGMKKFRVHWRAALKLESIKVNCAARYQMLIILIFVTAKERGGDCYGDESPFDFARETRFTWQFIGRYPTILPDLKLDESSYSLRFNDFN